jgi:DNA-binding XRE family transcriptional regulator
LEIVNNLQKIRTDNGLSRPQLAEQIGVSWETVKAYEVKGGLPSLKVALKIANVLKCSVEDVFSHTYNEETEDVEPVQE